MSFGSLKTLKLERTLGDATLSIAKQVPTDASEVEEFDKLDESIIESANNLRPFETDEDESVTKTSYPTIKDAEPKKTENKTKSKGRGRPKGSTSKKSETKEESKPETKNEGKKADTGKGTEVKEEVADQNAKTELLQLFQSTFEDQIGFSSEEAYEKEFNEFLSSLISMDYKTFLEKELTVSQLKTFKDLI